MCQMPATASATNQTSVIGPKNAATLRRAARLNREQRDQDHDGERHDVGLEAPASRSSMPSTADRTESAGVIIASP